MIAEVGIVVTGGLVRLTGSGLGCPTWPECTDESLVPVPTQSEGFHKFIEFGNRLLTFAVLVAALAALIVVLRPWLARRFPSIGALGQPGVRPSTPRLAGRGSQPGHRRSGRARRHHSAARSASGHRRCPLLALHGDDRRLLPPLPKRLGRRPTIRCIVLVKPELRWVAYALVAFSIAVLVLGTIVTGSGPHSGDADEIARFGLDVRMISWLHADVVLVFVGLALAFTLGARLSGAPPHATRSGLALIVACLAQGLIGYTQYFTGVPVPLVSLHMLGACLVWIATLEVLLSTRQRGARVSDGSVVVA